MAFRSYDPVYVNIGERSHRHKMYTAKMHHNSLLGRRST